jgi:hypothetical protein
MEHKTLDLNSIQVDQWKGKVGNHTPCLVCGRPIKDESKSKWVHLLTSGQLINTQDDSKVSNSQGFFPVGSECAKKIPTEFLFKKS